MREKLLLCAAALVAFGGSLGGEFQFDDFALLSDRTVTSSSGWWESWRLQQTRPLTWFTFWLSYQMSGENPLGYRAVSLALHVVVTLLLASTLRKLMDARAAFFAALVFAVHPALAEAVNYIFARSTLLAALFSLLAVRDWIAGRSWRAVLWFALGMLGKEECAAVPLFLIFCDWSRGNKIARGPIAAMLAVALALGVRVLWAASVTTGSQAGAQAGISPVQYFSAQGGVIWSYLLRLVIPWGFSADYEVADPSWWIAVAGWTGIAALGVMAWRRAGGLAPGFWFLGGLLLLLPSSSVLPAADLAADRRVYLPMLAFSALFGMWAQRLDRRAFAVWVIVLGSVSIRYTVVWRAPERLWGEALRMAPNKVRPRIQLARAVTPEWALALLREAEVLAPADAAVAGEQGRVLLSMGRADEALAAFGRALALAPDDARALNNRGAALAALGQTDAARADFERALARDPCLSDARVNLERMGVTPRAKGCR